ncbi:Oidioi.mRNA.OKI2018_I69.chr1.g926.t1.cds [Oikopleura dioica]|uniref:Oidioi.mRNA.OKI2018_I69.chr1.g926.t1.cds n=1 Tax=Oikopleura dioica TaxID=34765 RepID=A0ABN7SLF0_OIKDI|nr:Oidioi.mRNA.OKI2018_I69.chr1.g926.t1.cds [Oikopleura dioica]
MTKDVKKEKELKGFDQIYSRIPHLSGYQICILLFSSYTIILSGAVQNASVILNAKPEEYRCIPEGINSTDYALIDSLSPQNPCRVYDLTNVTDHCDALNDPASCLDLIETEKCAKCENGFVYSPNNTFQETVVSRFDWICEESLFPASSISTSLFMLGLLVGALGFGRISDIIGRKRGLMLAHSLCLVTNLLLYWADGPVSFTLMRFLAGAFAHACVVVSYVYCIEQVGPKWRTFLGCQHLQLFELGIVVLSIIGYYNRNWHDVQIGLVLVGLPFLPLYFYLPSSYKWLYSKGKNSEARATLKLISAKTGGTIDDEWINEFELKSLNNEEEKAGIADLIKNPYLRWKTVVMFFNWFVTSMVYYGLGLNAGSLSGNIFVNNALCGIFDAVAKFLSPFMIGSRFGRRGTLCFLFVAGGLACIGAMVLSLMSGCEEIHNGDCFLPEKAECKEIYLEIAKWLALAGKFCSSATFTIVYIYTAELNPTCVRATAVGLSSAGGRIGGAISPLVFGLDNTFPWFSNTFFGICGLLAGWATLSLPETKGQPMLQTMEDVNDVYQRECEQEALLEEKKTKAEEN